VITAVVIRVFVAAPNDGSSEQRHIDLLDRTAAAHYRRWDTYAFRLNREGDSDAVARRTEAGDSFRRDMTKLLQDERSFAHPLPALSQVIEVHESADGRVRGFSWDAGGGTGRLIERWFQFFADDGSFIAIEDKAQCTDCFGPPSIESIWQSADHPGVYLVYGATQVCSSCGSRRFEAYRITGHKLVQVNQFVTGPRTARPNLVVEWPSGTR
jgi:hypothetical protein